MPDRYQCLAILGLRSGSGKDEIKKAYLDLVKVWHPDRFTHDPALAAKASEKLKEINEAYETLRRLPEDPFRPVGEKRTYAKPSSSPVPARARRPSMHSVGSFRFLVILLLSALLFRIALSVFRGSFHNSSPGKSVRDIA